MATDITSVNNKDSFLLSSAPTSNFGTNSVVTINSGREFIFDFTLSAGSGTISKIAVFLFGNSGDAGNHIYGVHQLTGAGATAWTEASVTYNKYDGTNNWTTAGGDYSATEIDTYTWAGATSGYGEFDLVGGKSLSPLTLTWGDPVHLILVTSAGNTNGIDINSKEAVSNQPYLEITYTPAATTTSTTITTSSTTTSSSTSSSTTTTSHSTSSTTTSSSTSSTTTSSSTSSSTTTTSSSTSSSTTTTSSSTSSTITTTSSSTSSSTTTTSHSTSSSTTTTSSSTSSTTTSSSTSSSTTTTSSSTTTTSSSTSTSHTGTTTSSSTTISFSTSSSSSLSTSSSITPLPSLTRTKRIEFSKATRSHRRIN